MYQINGECGVKNETLMSQIGGRSLALKITRTGFFWPTLSNNGMIYVKTCGACQRLSNTPQKPVATATPVISPIPFAMWGINLVGKLHKAKGGVEYAVVVVDYISNFTSGSRLVLITTKRFYEVENNQWMREQLNFTDELRGKALFKMVQYKHLMVRSYNRLVKKRQFNVGDLLLRMYAITQPHCKNKLSPKLEGPYKVTKVVGPATYEFSYINGKPINHTWHATRLRKYYI
ncbi:hypothetical protein LIER_04457 [Lithospermum erythrorhizon]|uniref:Integrase zinc-binding domain-containing protein n=1 Tax=Lithospermum erythrorhizon TaxID=34254 RepID=A0AAV3P1H5_LITER